MPPSKQSETKEQEMSVFKHLQKKYLEGKNKEDKERLITFAVGRKSHRRYNSDAFVLPVVKTLIDARDADAFYVASFIQNSATRVRLRKYLHQQFVEKDRIFLPQKITYPTPEQTVPGSPEELVPAKKLEHPALPSPTAIKPAPNIFQNLLSRSKALLKKIDILPRAL